MKEPVLTLAGAADAELRTDEVYALAQRHPGRDELLLMSLWTDE